MRVEVCTYEGRRYALPDPLEIRLEYACGTPCDSLWLETVCRPEDAEIYPKAVRVTVREDGGTVFTGVVDEVEWGIGPEGSRARLSGRSMAALLLDNEAQAADYGGATLEDILRDHVRPYGIAVGETALIPACPGFSVASGQSEWQVVYNFARYHGGVPPHFDREGRLILTPFGDAAVRTLGEETPVTRISCLEKRYGALSEVLVRDKTRQVTERVTDGKFLAQGGACRRVVTTGGRSTAQTMRYSGQFQIEKSRAGRRTVSLTAPRLFFAWPGELIRLERTGWTGTWRVLESVVTRSGQGGRTALKLGLPDAVI